MSEFHFKEGNALQKLSWMCSAENGKKKPTYRGAVKPQNGLQGAGPPPGKNGIIY